MPPEPLPPYVKQVWPTSGWFPSFHITTLFTTGGRGVCQGGHEASGVERFVGKVLPLSSPTRRPVQCTRQDPTSSGRRPPPLGLDVANRPHTPSSAPPPSRPTIIVGPTKTTCTSMVHDACAMIMMMMHCMHNRSNKETKVRIRVRFHIFHSDLPCLSLFEFYYPTITPLHNQPFNKGE